MPAPGEAPPRPRRGRSQAPVRLLCRGDRQHVRVLLLDRFRTASHQAPQPMGASIVYRVLHNPSGRVLVGASTDAPAMLRRIRVQLEMDSHPNRQLQHDWGTSGETGFDFEIVDLLDEPDSPIDAITRDLGALHDLWREKLLSDSTPTY